MYSLRIRAPLVAQVAGVIPNVLAPPLHSLRHTGERFQPLPPLAHRVSLATMAEVKKNFCDVRIAVRQLVSHIHLAGTASACQRKLLVESSVGWLSRISRRKSPFRFTTFFSCLLFAFNFLEFQRSLDERERTLCRCSELLSEWFGSVGRVFYERKTTELVPRRGDTSSTTTRVKAATASSELAAPSYHTYIAPAESC